MIKRIKYPQPPAFGGTDQIVDRSEPMGPAGKAPGGASTISAHSIADMQPILTKGQITDLSKRVAAIGERPTSFASGYVARYEQRQAKRRAEMERANGRV